MQHYGNDFTTGRNYVWDFFQWLMKEDATVRNSIICKADYASALLSGSSAGACGMRLLFYIRSRD